MGTGVFKVQRPAEQGSPSALGGVLGTVGGIAGTYFSGGNPAVGMAASKVGSQLGEGIAPGKQATAGSKDLSVAPSDDHAMARRQAAMDEQPERQIANSIDSLKYLPPEQQQEYGPSLMQAQEMARKNRGMA